MSQRAQQKLTTFFSPPKAGQPTPSQQTPASQVVLTPEQLARIEQNKKEAAERLERNRLARAAEATSPDKTSPSVDATPPTKRAHDDSSPCQWSPGEDSGSPEMKRARLSDVSNDSTSSPVPVTRAAPAHQRFVPAPLNASGLLQSEANHLREKQQEKESKEVRYTWLVNQEDNERRSRDDPEYDPRFLYVPPTALARMTDFERQYWEIKKNNWDVVVFFKKGKFYELYETDADIGHFTFNLKITPRVNMRMVGFPESSFHTWAKQFIYKGHKVGRVEQMEYRLQKSKGDKSLVQRQLCQILTLGSLTDESMLTDHRPNYMLSIKEDHVEGAYAVCFVDAARAEFHIARLPHTVQRSELITLLHRTKPKELIVEKDNLSKVSLSIIRKELVDPIINKLTPGQEFWPAAETREALNNGSYFTSEDIPAVFQKYMEDSLVMQAVGGCICYLKRLKLDEELLSMKHAFEYDPEEDLSHSLILDGTTLANLEVLENSRDQTAEGTILQYLNHALTPFGKREFKKWVCNPLRDVSAIEDRLDAVEDLIANMEARRVIEGLKALPDLERLISRVFAGGRDVTKVAWVDLEVASKRQVSLFLAVVAGFRKLLDTITKLGGMVGDMSSGHLKRMVTLSSPEGQGEFPDIRELLEYFENSFDKKKAKEEGLILPNKGVNPKYDACMKKINAIERTLEEILVGYRDEFQDEKITYKHIGKESHQIEIPKATLARRKNIPIELRKMSETKAVGRYWTDKIEELSAKYKEAVQHKDEVLADVLRVIMNQFGEKLKEWQAAVRIAAELDCLYSLAIASSNSDMSRPKFAKAENGQAMFEAKNIRHPCVKPAVGSKVTTVVPNSVKLGNGTPLTILLTGPNMGGKSTVMRSMCVAAIMAQMGCYVCAEECTLTPVDRIFTRIGAMDRIMSGQSTFMVELEETSNILHHATKNSLVILDELGRGTSTFDGYAIAYSVLKYIAERIQCRTIFSTHYYFLTEEMARECGDIVAPYHMHYSVDEQTGEVTFLYALVPGICQKSYGIDVARKAGLLSHILSKATQKSEEFEAQSPLNAYSRDKQREVLLRRMHSVCKANGEDMDIKQLKATVQQFLSQEKSEA